MLKYSKGQDISLNLTLVNNDGNPEDSAVVNWYLYNSVNTLELSGSPIYNAQLGSYIDIINPSSQWNTQEEGIYHIVWEIQNTVEDYPNTVTEELHIHDYDNKLDRILGLVHENMLIDNPVYDKFDNLQSARLRLYSDKDSVGTNNNVIATYTIQADTINAGKFNNWKQVREE